MASSFNLYSQSNSTPSTPPPPDPQNPYLLVGLEPGHDNPLRAHVSCNDLALLDDVAHKMQLEPDSLILILAGLGKGERGGARMAMARGYGYRLYLANGEGQQHIAPDRIIVYANAAVTTSSPVFFLPSNDSAYKFLVEKYTRMADSFVPESKQLSFCGAVSNSKTLSPYSRPR